MAVPFMDLNRTHNPIRADIYAAISAVIDRNSYIIGPALEEFEKDFAEYCEVRYCVGLDTGTSALELALRAWNIGEGDEVITAPNSFIATASAIAFTGAKPVFVDIDPVTCTINADLNESAIPSRTKAIVPVHLYGQPADMDPIVEIARQHGLKILEDACQAHGARYKGRRCGSLGDAAAFSFYPAKNLGCFGDGGALVTDDEETADRVRMLRNYGQDRKYHHLFLAYNRRLDTLQAAVLNVKLPLLDGWNQARRQVAEWYGELLDDSGLLLPSAAPYAEHVWHLYVVRSDKRELLAQHLQAEGIGWGLHYPVPIHLQPAYAHLGLGPGSFPEAERSCETVLSLPMFPGMTREEAQAVAGAVRAAI